MANSTKKTSSRPDLVIVESPSKAKTIGKYLGPGYDVQATMGHIRDLPKSRLGVDVEHRFQPHYEPIKDKEDLIRKLKAQAEKSNRVYLATDPDREGEAISWHLKELLELPDNRTFRVTFNEITRNVVQQSIAAPRSLDMGLVDAQQARRILDRIVGYELSPLLWKKVRRGLSAGRVQSVATRLLVDREEEIRAFQPQKYWSITATLERVAPNQGEFKAQFHGNGKKMELHSEAEVDTILAAVAQGTFRVSRVRRQEKNRTPAPPFTTSTLQQEASRKLGMSPSRTMAIAQQLYEGVEITGQGAVGLITYVRTDSQRLSEEAIAAVRSFIGGRYGQSYCPAQARHYKSRNNAQDAHEAIRPSDVTLVPDTIRGDLTVDQYRLYRLIWDRFVACQMANAVYDMLSIEVENSGYFFRASHSSMKFSGFTAVYEEGKDEEEDTQESPLPDLKEGEALQGKSMAKDQHFTQPPPRYTDASLIRTLEEQGIGRPSTYAPTISTILNRYYAVKDGRSLRPTPLGEVVTGLMKDKFQDIVDPAFTARMEARLDGVEEGKEAWQNVLEDFYQGFHEELTHAETDLERIQVPPEVSDEVCPQCGKNLIVKSGRFGRFLACPGWPDCNFTMPLVVEMPGSCPVCGGRLFKRSGKSKRNGKQYFFYCCEHRSGKEETRTCDFITWDVPVKDTCPECGKTLFKTSGRGARKPFCINPSCSRFVPEDQRGGWRKKTPESGEEEEAPAPEAEDSEEKKKPASTKKPSTRRKAAAEAASGDTVAEASPKRTPRKKADAEDAPEAAGEKSKAKRTSRKKTSAETASDDTATETKPKRRSGKKTAEATPEETGENSKAKRSSRKKASAETAPDGTTEEPKPKRTSRKKADTKTASDKPTVKSRRGRPGKAQAPSGDNAS